MLNPKTLILCIIVCLSFQVKVSYSSENTGMPKFYYHMIEQGGWVPYHTGAQTGQKGLFLDVTDALQPLTNIEFIPVNFPPKRAQKALIDGILDFEFVCLEWLNDAQLKQQFIVTVPLFEITEHLITLKNNAHLFPNRESMFNQRVGTIAGYFYFDDSEFIRSDFLNENSLILGLKNQRFKVAILERETAKYWANRNNTEISFAALHTAGKLVMRLRKEHKDLLPMINKGINQLKTSGKLRAILEGHKVDAKIF